MVNLFNPTIYFSSLIVCFHIAEACMQAHSLPLKDVDAALLDFLKSAPHKVGGVKFAGVTDNAARETTV
jgi:hypothetical protein